MYIPVALSKKKKKHKKYTNILNVFPNVSNFPRKLFGKLSETVLDIFRFGNFKFTYSFSIRIFRHKYSVFG